MGMTMVEKILARASGSDEVHAGDMMVCDVDTTVLLDIQFGDALGWEEPTRIADPDRVVVVMDHAVPAPSIDDAQAGTRARRFVDRFGISRFYDIGHHGICHQVIAEAGLALPGQILACTDSHTCAAGAFNCAARGLGPAEVLQILCTGKTWFKVGPTIRYELVGAKPRGVSGKDVFLYLAATYGDATNHNVEFGGPGLASLAMSDRRTVATQGAEIAADFTIFPADEQCVAYLDGRADAPYSRVQADADAVYAVVRTVDLSDVEPHVARPGTVINNAVPVSQLEGTKVDQCFIGSCANGQLEDLEVAAAVLQGRKVAPNVRLIVTPASQSVYLQAVRRGLVETLAEAGAVVTNSTCGACFGYHMGVVGPGEVCLTASTRNFKGRMGSPEAEIYMASPATVAMSAVTGVITDARHADAG